MNLLNNAAVRRYLLERARSTGRKRFTRVSAEVFEDINRQLTMRLDDLVHRHPSKGSTLYPLV